MPKTIIRSDRAWKSTMNFAQATRAGGTLYACSVGLKPDGTLAGHDIASQTRQTIDNIEALIEAAGGSLKDVVKCTIYLAGREHYEGMNAVYFARFADEPPLRATVICDLAFPELLVEIDATAYLGA